MVVALKLILSTIPYKYYSETCKRKIFKIGCCCIRIVRKNISLLIVTFIIISVTTVTTALVQSEQFKTSPYYVLASPQQKENVTITVLVQRLGKEDMVKELLNDAVNKVRSNHSDLSINLKYVELHDLPPAATKDQMLTAIANGTHIDIISLDQIWLGEFAEKGFLTDLTNYTEKWGKISEWYQSNLDGGVYDDRIYGIWYETDVRGTWYWKDLLNQANVDPNMLKTWDGYIAAAKKLNTVLRPQGIEGVHLTGDSHSPDVWYPYLWMLGGAMVENRPGHPTKDFYWYPSYNSSEGVRALEFIKDQVEAGVKPQTKFFDTAFAQNKSFAVMLAGSWMPGEFPRQEWSDLEERLGFIPTFPVPSAGNVTATMMGGWLLSIPQSSENKDLAWELITIALEPDRLAPWLERYGYLPTQIPIGEKVMQANKSTSFPYYAEMVSMIPYGHNRPAIPEYPQIASHIKQALDDVYYGLKDPKKALDDAAIKSAQALGW